ncbi:hypothetical protein GCM10025871_35850 [Deinococcus metallilatus]|nr:hypothetical protein GCM10025871_35850 [Deinococcus metallilatus]
MLGTLGPLKGGESPRMHKKRTTKRKRRQPLTPKRVAAWAGAVSAVLFAVKLLVEIIKLIFLP